MLMPGRSYNSAGYRYGFNGQEKDDEVYGSGNINTAEFWQYDTRLGRRWNVDPLTYEWQSSYAAFNNNPVYFNDPLGLQGERPQDGTADNPQNGETCTNPDGTGEYFANGSWHQSRIQGTQLPDAEITTPRREGANPPQEYGNVYRTDREGESIWPVGIEPGGNGWTFVKGPDFYRTEGRTNMVQVMHDYPNSYGLFKPRTINDLKAEEAVQSGGKDAVLGLGAGVAAPFAIGYGAMYGPMAYGMASEAYITTTSYLYVQGQMALGQIAATGSGALGATYAYLKGQTGGMYQWYRNKPSYSFNLQQNTLQSISWGASPKHLDKIGSPSLRNLNMMIRLTKLPPGSMWRTADAGHFHIKK
ncbi:MAG: hypothetical protein IPN22_10995 [Bacteroidetes bacterium]|nr:hypothetical protein [Bacteroidota bacterium]